MGLGKQQERTLHRSTDTSNTNNNTPEVVCDVYTGFFCLFVVFFLLATCVADRSISLS